jgi:electron transfer flavoprotein beta subunit
MGADKAVLLKSDDVRDTTAVAKGLAGFLKDQSPDIVFFGKQSVDGDASAVGQMVAEILGLPCISVAVKLEVEGTVVKAEREIEGGHERVETNLPCVITAQKGLNEPRYPSLKGIMGAKKKPIEEIPAPAAESLSAIVEMIRPPQKSAGKIVGTDASAVPELVRLLHEEAKVI